MIFSVYRYDRKAYDYYDDRRGSPTHSGSPSLVTMGGIGEAPDSAAWPLPPGVVKVGSGELPRGKIASLGAFRSGDGLKLGMLAAAAYLAWRYLR